MMSQTVSAPAASSFERLSGFLRIDPSNLRLIEDAAGAAVEEGRWAEVAGLVERYAGLAPLSPRLRNLAGLAAMGEGRHADAVALLEPLLAEAPEDPRLRFNLAWASAMTAAPEAVVALVDEAVIAAAPAAAALKVQALHRLGRLDEALAEGAAYVAAGVQDQALMSALAVAAVDAENTELARAYALKAGDTHEGLSTLAALALDQGEVSEATDLFDRALAVDPTSGRAQLGKGLALLAQGDSAAGTALVEAAATRFGDHLGSWIAAGWGHFAQGDLVTARRLFDKALALDDSFAESHGALAVLDALDGRIDAATRRCQVALRLDRACLSAALAKSLMAAMQGDAGAAERIRAAALNTPLGPDGRTLAQAMSQLASGVGRVV
ncbi:hypothetical protein DDF62_17730 [Caulobacter radicis]|nr:hypothetical protein DDF62_17730 [Caulobacter radicis]